MEYTSFLKELLDLTFLEKASDLHLSVDRYPSLRITGRLVPLIKMKKISPEDSQGLAFELMNEEQRERFLQEKEIDFSYNFEDRARFRVNIFFESGNISSALRLVPNTIPTIEKLNLPPILHEFTRDLPVMANPLLWLP